MKNRRKILVQALILFFISVGLSLAGSDAKCSAQNLMKNIFPVGIWYDGRVEGINCGEGFVDVPFGLKNARAYYEKTFKDIKAHGIDIVVIPNTPPQYRQTLLSVADEVGVKIVLEIVEFARVEFGGELSVHSPYMIQDKELLSKRLKDLIEPLRSHESLLCYQIIDEPPVKLADNFQKVAQVLAELDPAHPAFSCLCREKELSRTSRMGTQMIIFDRYPIAEKSKPGDYDFKSWIVLLEQLRGHSRDNDIPYWMVVQTFGYPGRVRMPTEAELRAMTYLSLSRNCKGIFFFLYNSMTQGERLQGLVDTELKSRPLWVSTAKLGEELKQLGPMILEIQPAAAFASSDAEKIDVQCFADGKGGKYIIVTNLNVLEAVNVQLKVKAKSKELRNILTGEASAIEQQGGSATVKLAAGNGAVLRLE